MSSECDLIVDDITLQNCHSLNNTITRSYLWQTSFEHRLLQSSIKDKQCLTFFIKFLSHPVVYNLLEKVWRGRFAGLRLRSKWKWRLLKLYSLLDIVLFPFMFAILFFTHSINTWRRRSKGALCNDIKAILLQDEYIPVSCSMFQKKDVFEREVELL